jgi:NAD(P)-dependent dehydrogenase (short-subunit alcohol dehydrogenase family)
MRLAGKVAIITGAASGMGAATARMFVREGAKVLIADVMEHEGRQVANAIGDAARFEALDVTNEDNWAAVVAAATRHFGKLDVLVNSAGISGSAEQDLYSTAAWHRIMAVNATGVFLGIKHAVPAMIAGGGGSIVNLSSIAGIIGSEGVHMAYNASKAAVRLMTKSTAVQHAQHRIRANSVHPGIMPPMRTSGRTADPAVRAARMHVIPCADRARSMKWRMPFCSSPPMNHPTSPVRKSMSMAEPSPYRRGSCA